MINPVVHPSLNHTIWLEQYCTAFVYIPKVACTSWKLFLAQAIGLPLPSSYGAVHDAIQLPLPYVSGMSPEKQQNFLDSLQKKEIKVTAVLREPRERILSAYLDKIKLHKNKNSYFSLQVMPSIREHADIPTDQYPSFEQFLHWIAHCDNPHVNNDHWISMSSLIGIDELENSCFPLLLWRAEEMKKAVAHFSSLLKISIPFPSMQALGPRSGSGAKEELRFAINPAAELLIQKIYRSDLKLYQSLS